MAGDDRDQGAAVIRDLYYARLCGLTYRTADFAFTGTHEADEFRATLTPSAGGPIIAFRGSSEAREWAMDLIQLPGLGRLVQKLREAAHSPYARLGVVHTGFMVGAEALYPSIKLALDGRRPTLVGHSLGGALALIVGAMLTLDGNPPLEIVTFGAPRVAGAGSFRAVLDQVEVRQYHNGADMVPTLPPSYHHARDLIPLHVLPHSRDPVANHFIDAYIRSLEAIAGNPADGPVLAGENYSLALSGAK